MRRLPIIAYALLQLVSPAVAGDDPQATYAQALKSHVEDLDSLSEWCQNKKIFGKRDEVYERILRFDPAHEKARRRLKYEQVDGEWVQDEGYKRPLNHSRPAIEEFRQRMAGIVDGFDAQRAAAFQAAKSPEDVLWALGLVEEWVAEEPDNVRPETVLRTTRVRAYQAMWSCGNIERMAEIGARLREAYPDDNIVNVVLEEAQVGGKWVLKETQQALKRRPALQARSEALIAEVQLDEVELTDEEMGLAIPNLVAFKTHHVRVISSAPDEHRMLIARTLEAAGQFLATASFHDPKRRKGLRIFVFSKKGQVDQFLQRVKSKNDALVKERETHKLDIFWLDGFTLVVDAIMPAGQLDLATSLVVTMMLSDTHFENQPLPGWLDEGISRHVTFLMTGTRMTVGVAGRYGSGDRVVPESYHDWIKRAQEEVAKEKEIDLRLLIGKGVDAYSVRDSIVAYAFAVFMLEGVGLMTGRFLEELGKGTDPDIACRKVFDRPLAVLEHRFRRWLDEMVASKAGG